MVKANKISLDAKAYINGQVNDMREKINKAPDEETRKQLVGNFKETASSEEYQEKLAVVKKDTDIIRKYAKRKKGGDITPEEFDAAKVDFYGKNMNLEFGEDFEKLDLGKKVDYIFEKFGDTDYAADLIIQLFDPLINKYTKKEWASHYDEMKEGKNEILKKIIKNHRAQYLDQWAPYVRERFGRGIVALRLNLFLTEYGDGNYDTNMFDHGVEMVYDINQNTLLKGFLGKPYERKMPVFVSGCKDGSISDYKVLDLLVKYGLGSKWNIEKMSPEGQKYWIDGIIKKNGWNSSYFLDETESGVNTNINLGKDVDVLEYIINSMLVSLDDKKLEEFCNYNLSKLQNYHNKIKDLFIRGGKLSIVKKYINKFIGLTDIEKAEILGDTELENKLNKEKFDSDLAKLQELGEKLGVTIEVKEKKELEQEQSEEQKEKGKGWRSWFGKKGKE